MKNKKGNALALAPIGVFLILYLGLGILIRVCDEDSDGNFIMYRS